MISPESALIWGRTREFWLLVVCHNLILNSISKCTGHFNMLLPLWFGSALQWVTCCRLGCQPVALPQEGPRGSGRKFNHWSQERPHGSGRKFNNWSVPLWETLGPQAFSISLLPDSHELSRPTLPHAFTTTCCYRPKVSETSDHGLQPQTMSHDDPSLWVTGLRKEVQRSSAILMASCQGYVQP